MKNIILILAVVMAFVACNHRKDLADAYGNFEVDDLIVAAEVSGRMISMSVSEGSELRKGQVIGQIDTTHVLLQVAQIEAQIAAVKSKVSGVYAQIESQKQQKENINVNLERVEKLLKSGAATQQQFDDLNGNIKLIDKQISASKTQVGSILKEVEVLKAQRDLLYNQYEKCTVVSGLSGVVLGKYVEEGEIVGAGKPILKVADLNHLYLRCYIAGNQLNEVRIGQKVNVFIDSVEEEMMQLSGVVSWISTQAEFTPKIIQTKEERVKLVYGIKVKVANNGQLKIGMPGEMRIIR